MKWDEAREELLFDPDVLQEYATLYYEECLNNNVRADILMQTMSIQERLDWAEDDMWTQIIDEWEWND